MNETRRVRMYVGNEPFEAEVTHHTRDDRSPQNSPDEWFTFKLTEGFEEELPDYRDLFVLAFPEQFAAYEDSL